MLFSGFSLLTLFLVKPNEEMERLSQIPCLYCIFLAVPRPQIKIFLQEHSDQFDLDVYYNDDEISDVW